MGYKVIKDCVDFPLLLQNLSKAELRHADRLCAKHENAVPNKKGMYACGCLFDDENGYGNYARQVFG